MPEPQLQLDRLRRLYTTQRSARLLLNYAARQSNAPRDAQMTVDSIHGILKCEEKPSVSRRELVQTLRAFAQAWVRPISCRTPWATVPIRLGPFIGLGRWSRIRWDR
jgi:hypothetical protein